MAHVLLMFLASCALLTLLAQPAVAHVAAVAAAPPPPFFASSNNGSAVLVLLNGSTISAVDAASGRLFWSLTLDATGFVPAGEVMDERTISLQAAGPDGRIFGYFDTWFGTSVGRAYVFSLRPAISRRFDWVIGLFSYGLGPFKILADDPPASATSPGSTGSYRLLVPGHTSSPCYLLLMNPSDGSEIWALEESGNPQSGAVVIVAAHGDAVTVIADENTLAVRYAIGATGDATRQWQEGVGNTISAIYASNDKNGNPIVIYPCNPCRAVNASNGIVMWPLTHDGKQAFGIETGLLLITATHVATLLDLHTGVPVWTQVCLPLGDSTPQENFQDAYQAGDFFMFNDTTLCTISPQGQIRWRAKIPSGPVMGPFPTPDGHLLLVFPNFTVSVSGLDGTLVWQSPVSGRVALVAPAATVPGNVELGDAFDAAPDADAATGGGLDPSLSSSFVLLIANTTNLTALDSLTGRPLWRASLNLTEIVPPSDVSVRTSLHVAGPDGRVFGMIEAQNQSYDAVTMFSIRPTVSSDIDWATTVPNSATLPVQIVLANDGTYTLLSPSRGEACQLELRDPTNGSLIWQVPEPGYPYLGQAFVAHVDGRAATIIAEENSVATRYNISSNGTAVVEWTTPGGGGTLVVMDASRNLSTQTLSTIYTKTFGLSPIKAYDATTGTYKWSWSLSAELFYPYGAISTGFLLMQGNRLFLLDQDSGKFAWNRTCEPLTSGRNATRSSRVTAYQPGDIFLYSAPKLTTLCVMSPDGELRWSALLPDVARDQHGPTPTLEGNLVIVTTNTTLCLSGADGHLLWQAPIVGDQVITGPLPPDNAGSARHK